ncbi:MAG: hypothetical protein ABJE80_18675 [Reichenbachiella sp.]|uniref:hypothetical protein n=1 Tax=Reichenbachiella sp. TaxID=2184521 RepID=UPI0032666867
MDGKFEDLCDERMPKGIPYKHGMNINIDWWYLDEVRLPGPRILLMANDTPIVHHHRIENMNDQEVTWSFDKTKYTTTNTGPAVVSMAHLVLVPLPFFFE